MTTFHEFVGTEGRPPEWPYPILYDQERLIETDVLVIGGGIAGCWAAISAAIINDIAKRQQLVPGFIDRLQSIDSGMNVRDD